MMVFRRGMRRTPKMALDQRYGLLEILPGEGANSFKARQKATGREVTVHVVTGSGLLAEFHRMSTRPPQVLDSGEDDGTAFVVTEAPPHLPFGEWLRAYG